MPVLILANKQDLQDAQPPEAVQQMLGLDELKVPFRSVCTPADCWKCPLVGVLRVSIPTVLTAHLMRGFSLWSTQTFSLVLYSAFVSFGCLTIEHILELTGAHIGKVVHLPYEGGGVV